MLALKLFLFKILFIYLTEHKQGEGQAEGEADRGRRGFPLRREPDTGLDPSTAEGRC